jgi:hypothetical protein
MSGINNQTNQQFRESLISNTNQSERIALSFNGHRTIFYETIQRILDEYGLAQKLEEAKQQGQKLRILQVNCAEGLYLHELARILEERDLLEGAELYGITKDPTQISTADIYSKVAKPPRPYLNFYQHNLHQPLSECLGLHEGLKASGSVQFDLLFGANETLAFLKEAKTVLTQLYLDNVKAGGLICFTEFIFKEGPEGWIAPHPALVELTRIGSSIVQSYNLGVEVALEMMAWLRELGSEQLTESKTKVETGGQAEQGKTFLRSMLLAHKILGSSYVKAGLIEQAHYDELMRVLYQELTPQHLGQITFNIVIARKPLNYS